MYIEKYSLYSFSKKAPALDRVRSYKKMYKAYLIQGNAPILQLNQPKQGWEF